MSNPEQSAVQNLRARRCVNREGGKSEEGWGKDGGLKRRVGKQGVVQGWGHQYIGQVIAFVRI